MRSPDMEPFVRWLEQRCVGVDAGVDPNLDELVALSRRPSHKVCSFRSMMSYGSHYRVEGDEAGGSHVTYDSGVAELQACRGTRESGNKTGFVDLVRVGTLKDTLVFDYGLLNVVLMAVSWVTPHTELQPRLRRDGHGFWLANMAATPRCTNDMYILPSLASQVRSSNLRECFATVSFGGGTRTCRLSIGTNVSRYFSSQTRPSLAGVLCCKRRRGEGE